MNTRTASIATTSTRRSAARRRMAAGLIGLVAAGGIAGITAPAQAQGTGTLSPAPICVGKKIFATHDNQVIHGTCGDDLIKVGKYDNVTVHAHDGNDDIRAGWGGHVVNVHGGKGNDSISTYENRLFAWGDEGHDTIEGGQLDDVLRGGGGNDDIASGPGADFLAGEGGDDFLNADDWGPLSKADQVWGGAGHDEARFESEDTVNSDVEVKDQI